MYALMLLLPGVLFSAIGLSVMYSRCSAETTATVYAADPTPDYGRCRVAYGYEVRGRAYSGAETRQCAPAGEQGTARACYGARRPSASTLDLRQYVPDAFGVAMLALGAPCLAVAACLAATAALAAAAPRAGSPWKLAAAEEDDEEEDAEAARPLARDSAGSLHAASSDATRSGGAGARVS